MVSVFREAVFLYPLPFPEREIRGFSWGSAPPKAPRAENPLIVVTRKRHNQIDNVINPISFFLLYRGLPFRGWGLTIVEKKEMKRIAIVSKKENKKTHHC